MKLLFSFLLFLPTLTWAIDYQCDGNLNSLVIEGTTVTFFELEHLGVGRAEIIISHDQGHSEIVERKVQEFREEISSPDFTMIIKGNRAILTETTLNFLKDKTFFCSEYHRPRAVRVDPQAGRRNNCSSHCH